MFLNRLSSGDAKKDGVQSFIGVPIVLDYILLDTLVVSLPYNVKREYEHTLKFLTLVASAQLQPIRVRHVIE